MKIHKIQGDISKQIANSIKDYCSIDCERHELLALITNQKRFFAFFIIFLDSLFNFELV